MNGLRRRRGQPPGESRRSRMPVALRGQPLNGELQLRLAVLEDCLRSLLLTRGNGAGERRRRRELAWIESRDREAPPAVERPCDALGTEPERPRPRAHGALGPPG